MNKKISIKMLIIIVLIGIICVLILSNVNNKNIKQQEESKEQLGETTEENAYVEMQTHLSEVNEKEQKLISFKSTIARAITDKGVKTSEDADANTMASNIRSIKNGIFSEWNGLEYITDNLSINASRVIINSGGYCIKDNYCYIKMNLTSNYAFNVNDAIYNFPQSTINQGVIVSIDEHDFIPTNTVFGRLCPTTNPQRLEFSYFPKGTTVWIYAKYPINI